MGLNGSLFFRLMMTWKILWFGGFIQHEVMLQACFERGMVIIVSALIFYKLRLKSLRIYFI